MVHSFRRERYVFFGYIYLYLYTAATRQPPQPPSGPTNQRTRRQQCREPTTKVQDRRQWASGWLRKPHPQKPLANTHHHVNRRQCCICEVKGGIGHHTWPQVSVRRVKPGAKESEPE